MSGQQVEVAEGVVLQQWCLTFLAALKLGGIDTLVISPGSRNTPLTACALSMGGIECHSVIDERSAGFFALGLAKSRRRGVALLCTSGSAGAHYYPALIEAFYAQVPLVAITADRPPELQGIGAPQTIHQPGMFGTHVRAAANLEPPSSTRDAHEELALRVVMTARAARAPVSGPVHINVPFRKPLEPQDARSEAEQLFVRELAAWRSALAPDPEKVGTQADLDELLSELAEAKRVMVTLGPAGRELVDAVRGLARTWGAPCLEEFGTGEDNGLFEFLATRLSEETTPDLILHFGPPIVSTRWNNFLRTTSARLCVVPGPVFQDPSQVARVVVVGDAVETSERLIERVAPADAWRGSDALEETLAGLRRELSTSLSTAAESGSEPLAVHGALMAAVRSDADLMLGNSLPLRIASWMMSNLEGARRPPITARGANGIDGTLAWAAGCVLATARASVLLVGDVTFAHDVGSLTLLKRTGAPLVVVIVDNGGGRIFDHLPARAVLSDEHFEFWTTKPEVDFASACEAFGIPYVAVEEAGRVEASVDAALETGRSTVLHVRTDPTTTIAVSAALRGLKP